MKSRLAWFGGFFGLALVLFFPTVGLAGGSVGGEINLNLLQFVGDGSYDVATDNDDFSGDIEFDADMSPGIGLTINYETPSYFVGGKLFFTSVKGDGKLKSDEFDADGSTTIDFRQIGPWFGYYFKPDRLRPMILGGLTYNMCRLDPGDAPEGDITFLGFHVGGGVKYFVASRVALGGGGRLDYYHTLDKYEETIDLGGLNGDLKGDINWLPLTGFFFVEYHWGAIGSAAPVATKEKAKILPPPKPDDLLDEQDEEEEEEDEEDEDDDDDDDDDDDKKASGMKEDKPTRTKD